MQRVHRHSLAATLLLAGIALTARLDSGLTDETRPAASHSAFQPRFEITWFRGELRLDGHTLSSGHETMLTRSANRTFLHRPVLTHFTPLGVAPGYWQDVTVRLVELLGVTRSAAATVAGSQVTIRAVVTEAGWDEGLALLRASLPDDVSVSVDVTRVSDSMAVNERCERIAARQEFAPIGFKEASTVFRASAYPVLDQIVALADACRDFEVTITGHSDSTGDAVFNQQLSMARAQAVADFVARRGIAPARVVAQGAGASHPVADNSTRYGRSLNRRIDVDFSIIAVGTADEGR